MDSQLNIPVESELTPFLKWAGGKRWLTQNHFDLFPHKFSTYFEPFLGSAAVFFALQPEIALLSDTNEELIDTYLAVKDRPDLVYRYLREHQRLHGDDYYYEVRSSRPTSLYARAARLIYLNRTCWNALYRVNQKGEFNVPRGTKNSVLLPTDDFNAISNLLDRCEIVGCRFEESISQAGQGDFVFADPPYTVKHNLNGFVKYNEQIFSWDDQCSLATELIAANERGAFVLCTNANHDSVKALYKDDFRVRPVTRNSVLAASAKHRALTSELVITNY